MRLRLPKSRSFHLGLLAITCAGLLPSHAWRPSLYPVDLTPPDEASFTSDMLIQDFSYAGYRRGEEPIPEIVGPIFNAATTYGADPSGASDSTTAIQSAILAAAAEGGGVVFLPAGTYRVAPVGTSNAALRIQNPNIVLRGAGVGQTYLLNTSFQMRGKAVVRIAPSSTPLGTIVAITADLDRPTRRIPVANASAFQVGDIIRMTWDFTQGWIDEHNQGTWWSEGSAPAPAEYIREVTAVNTEEGWIEIDVPTRYTMKIRDNASVRRVSGKLSGVGVEGISIANEQHPATTFGENDYNVEGTAAWDCHASWLVHMSNTIDSWINDVHSFQPAGNTSTCHMLSNGISLGRCFRVTVANCEMRRSQYGGGGGNGYMYRVQHSHENLIMESVADFSRHGFVISHAGTSGNVFLRCEDIETKRSTGSTGSYETSGSGSDHHMHFSHSNLFDMCHAHNSFYTASHRGTSSTIPHGLTSAHGVYWNTSGSGTRYTNIVLSSQARYGYVIGTSGARSGVSNPTTGNTAPADHVEGIGTGTTLQPQSLYLDQVAKRVQGILVNAGPDGISNPDSPTALNGSFYTYGEDPVTTLWSQVSGPATAVFADASSLTTSVTLPQTGTYVLELSATDGTKSASAQVTLEAAISAPCTAAHFIRGDSQNLTDNPLGYFTTASNVVGTQGASGNMDDRNAALEYTLPTLPPGTSLGSASLSFEITAARDTNGAANLPELHAYLLDSLDPESTGDSFFYHGPLDPASNTRRIGTTSVAITGTDEIFFDPGQHTRLFTLTEDALAMLRSFYNGNTPTRSTVYFRFNLSVDPAFNDYRRYRINTSADGSALLLGPNATPVVDAGANQTIALDQTLPWTPAELTVSPAAWYDAADSRTLTIPSGNAVSAWEDKSANANHAVQDTAAVRPTIHTATIGGLPTVSFRIGDGTNKQFLSAPNHASLNLDASGGNNVFAVMNYLGFNNQDAGLNVALSKGDILSANASYGIRVGSGNQLGYQAGSNGQVNSTNFSNQPLVYTGTGNLAANAAQIFVNGSLRNTSNPPGSFTSNNTNPLRIGRDGSTGRFANVDFGEILILGGALTAGEREQIEGYLAHKWSLDANLPAEHTYKEAAPRSGVAAANATLDGSATDAEGDSMNYLWSVVSGPGDVVFSNPAAPDSSTSFAVAGSYVLRLTVSDGISSSFDEVTITVQAPADNTFSNWIAGFDVGALTGFNDDPDGDGIANGLEAWFGTNPGEFSAGVVIEGTNGLATTLTHPQNPDPPADLVGIYEWSPDLVNWYPHGDGSNDGPSVSFFAETEGNHTTVIATASEDIPRMFLRVAVSQN